jgi:RND family efflux transporter MFP subunit
MKNKITVLLMILCLLVLAAGCTAKAEEVAGDQEEGPGQGSTPAGQEGPPEGGDMTGSLEDAVELVETETIALTSVAEEVETIGKVNAETLISIGADQTGTVEKIYVSVGDRVSVGDILYTVDNSSVVNDTTSQSASARNSLSSAKLSYDNALETYEENKKLYESGIISKADLDSSYDSLQVDKINYDNAKSNYDSIITSSEYSLDDTVLQATIDGVISAINVEVGQKSSGSDIEIMGDDGLLINTVVSNRVMEDLSLGETVLVTYNDREIEGTISQIGEGGINDTDSFEVNISVAKDGSQLKVGYRVDLMFNVFEEDDQIVVPRKCILSDNDGDYVFINDNGLAAKVYVTKGITNNGYVQVFGDLEVGDQLISKGQNYIAEGSKIALEVE